jgi:hypothetical protein
MIRLACEDAIKTALNIGDISPRRLLSVGQTATYLCLSEREIYNMLSTKELTGVRHGKRLMVDIRAIWRNGSKGIRRRKCAERSRLAASSKVRTGAAMASGTSQQHLVVDYLTSL